MNIINVIEGLRILLLYLSLSDETVEATADGLFVGQVTFDDMVSKSHLNQLERLGWFYDHVREGWRYQ